MNFTDSKKRVWFVTLQGLSLYDPLKDSIINFNIKEKKTNKYDNAIFWAIEDKAGNFWCWGAKGILYFNTHTGTFTRYTHNEKVADGLLSNTISHITLDRQGMPWIGVEQLGLQWVNKDRSKFTLYKNDPGQLHHFPGGRLTLLQKLLTEVSGLAPTMDFITGSLCLILLL